MPKKLKAPQTAEDYRTLLLQLVGSLTLNDTIGDTRDDIKTVLARIEYNVTEDPDSDDWLDDVKRQLAKDGITTLYGTCLGDEQE